MREGGVGLIAALREECRCILRWGGWRGRRVNAHTRMYEREQCGRRIRLVISGAGGNAGRAALGTLLHRFHPQCVISVGFAGGLDPSLRPGDLLWGRKVFHFEAQTGAVREGATLLLPPREVWDRPAEGSRWWEGSLVSVDRFVTKAAVQRHLKRGWLPAVLEMETYALGEQLAQREIPLMGLRGVSDEWDLEIAPIITQWTDEDLRVRFSRLMADLLGHPARVGFLLGLFRRSRRTSRSLETGLRILLNTCFQAP